MAVWGKVVGAFFGFLLGGPIGMALGVFLGHKFDGARQNLYYDNQTSKYSQQQSYFYATFAVMGHLAKAKGKVTKEEIQVATTLMDRMELQGQVRIDAQDAFREGKNSDFPLKQVLLQVRKNCSGRHDLLRFFLEVQIQAAFADAAIHPAEYQVLVVISEILGFSRHQLDQYLVMQEAAFNFNQQEGAQEYRYGRGESQADRLSKAYKILAVDESTDLKTIKRAYRKLMNEHHPDKLAATGLPSEMMEIAKRKAQEIQAAYDLIKKEREKIDHSI